MKAYKQECFMSFSSGEFFKIIFWTLGKNSFQVNYASQFLTHYQQTIQDPLSFSLISEPYFPITVFSRHSLHCDWYIPWLYMNHWIIVKYVVVCVYVFSLLCYRPCPVSYFFKFSIVFRDFSVLLSVHIIVCDVIP